MIFLKLYLSEFKPAVKSFVFLISIFILLLFTPIVLTAQKSEFRVNSKIDSGNSYVEPAVSLLYFPVIIAPVTNDEEIFTPLKNAESHLNIPTSDGAGQCNHPSVIDFLSEYQLPEWNGYRYWMAMTPYPNSDATKECPNLVASHDGINWKKPIGIVNPVVKADNDSCGSHLADPDIIYNPDDNSIWLFYMNRIHKKHTGSTINLIRIKSDLTYSTAQLLFRFNENDSNTIVSPCIWRESSLKWHMWGVRLQLPNQIAYLSSNDGIHWSEQTICLDKYSENPLEKLNYRPWHISCKPNFREKRVEFLINCSMISELSRSFITRWLFYAEVPMQQPALFNIPIKLPVLSTPQSMTGWDYPVIYRSTFTIENQDTHYFYRVWYSASSAKEGEWHIGYTQGFIGSPYSKLNVIGGVSKDNVIIIDSVYHALRVYNYATAGDSVVLELKDIKGREIFNKPLQSTLTEIDINTLPSGTYLAVIIYKYGEINREILKK